VSLLLLLASLASAAPSDSVALRAMTDELKRSVSRLKLGDNPAPYFLSYSMADTRKLELEASFGAVRDPHLDAEREIKVDVHVGGYAFDQGHYVWKDYWRHRPSVDNAPVGDDYDALRFSFWGLTDTAYKGALERLAQKKAFAHSRNMPKDAPDLSTETVSALPVFSPDRAKLDLELWSARARELSNVYREFPAIEKSDVRVYFYDRLLHFVDSEGRAMIKPASDFEVVVEASGHAADGLPFADKRRILALSESELPKPEELAALVRQAARELSDVLKAPEAETYIGPVLFEGQAAAEFFNQLFARSLSAPRAPWFEEDPIKEEFLSGDLADRLGLRVLPSFMSAYDDPTVDNFEGRPLLGRYKFDDEGLPARRVNLVEKGLLRDILMSRAPIKQRRRSNGHGRGAFSEFVTGRPGNLFLEAAQTKPLAELRKDLIERAKEYGMAYGLIVRRLADEESQEKGDALARPVLLYKLYPDGREELIRNGQFSGVSQRALRDIVGASSERTLHNYYQAGPHKMNRGMLQASIVCPSVLVAELELHKTDKKPEKKPALPHPFFAERK
jgi:TldD protein